MKRVGILLSFVVMGSLYGAETVTINADTPKSQYEPYLEMDAVMNGYCNFNAGKKTNNFSGNTLIWNDTPPNIDEGKGLFIYGGLAGEMVPGKLHSNDNKVYINGGDGIQMVYGGSAEVGGRAERNSVVIDGANTRIVQVVYGGYTNGNTLASNSVLIKNGRIEGNVIGGYSTRGDDITKNEVTIEGGVIKMDVRGAYSDGSGNVHGNIVTIRGGEIRGTIYGGKSNSLVAIDNTVNLDASGLNLNTIIGGSGSWNTFNDSVKGNTLNVRGKNINAGNILNFEKINFYLPSDIRANDVVLNLSGRTKWGYITSDKKTDLNIAKLAVTMGGQSNNLNKNDRIVLLKNPQGIIYPTEMTNHKENLQAIAGISTIYEFGLQKDGEEQASEGKELYAVVRSKVTPLTPLEPSEPIGDNQGGGVNNAKRLIDTVQKSILEPTAGAMALIGQSFDALSNSNLSSDGAGGAVLSGMKASDMRLESGSHVDVRSASFALGLAKEFDSLLTSLFMEFGGGKYDTFNEFGGMFNGNYISDIRGSGHMRYYGAGVLSKLDLPSDFYVEASAKLGRIKTDYKTVLPDGTEASYDVNRNYYGAHAGVGKVFEISDASDLDLYAKLFFTRVGKKQIEVNSESILLKQSDSLGTKLGFKYSYELGQSLDLFGGLAYERELDGEAKGLNLAYGTDIASPSIKGNTGIAEVGAKLKNLGNFEAAAKFEGMVGKRKGLSAGLSLEYKF